MKINKQQIDMRVDLIIGSSALFLRNSLVLNLIAYNENFYNLDILILKYNFLNQLIFRICY